MKAANFPDPADAPARKRNSAWNCAPAIASASDQVRSTRRCPAHRDLMTYGFCEFMWRGEKLVFRAWEARPDCHPVPSDCKNAFRDQKKSKTGTDLPVRRPTLLRKRLTGAAKANRILGVFPRIYSSQGCIGMSATSPYIASLRPYSSGHLHFRLGYWAALASTWMPCASGHLADSHGKDLASTAATNPAPPEQILRHPARLWLEHGRRACG